MFNFLLDNMLHDNVANDDVFMIMMIMNKLDTDDNDVDPADVGVQALPSTPSPAQLDEASNCSRCRSYFMKQGPECAHCKLQDAVKAYENCLFSYKAAHKNIISKAAYTKAGSKKSERTAAGAREGASGSNDSVAAVAATLDDDEFELKDVRTSRVDGPFTMIIKQMRSLALKHGDKAFVELGSLELKYIASLHDELTALHALWNRHLELLKVHDELDMVSWKSMQQLIYTFISPANKFPCLTLRESLEYGW